MSMMDEVIEILEQALRNSSAREVLHLEVSPHIFEKLFGSKHDKGSFIPGQIRTGEGNVIVRVNEQSANDYIKIKRDFAPADPDWD